MSSLSTVLCPPVLLPFSVFHFSCELSGRNNRWVDKWLGEKIARQLLGLSTSFLVLNIDYVVIVPVQMVHDSSFGATLMVWFLPVHLCILQLVIPFLFLGTVPDSKQKLKALNPWRQHAVVQPINHLRTWTLPLRNNIIEQWGAFVSTNLYKYIFRSNIFCRHDLISLLVVLYVVSFF
jgi:hypothetical protein